MTQKTTTRIVKNHVWKYTNWFDPENVSFKAIATAFTAITYIKALASKEL